MRCKLGMSDHLRVPKMGQVILGPTKDACQPRQHLVGLHGLLDEASHGGEGGQSRGEVRKFEGHESRREGSAATWNRTPGDVLTKHDGYVTFDICKL